MFHVANGLFFQRLDDSGAVRIVKRESNDPESPIQFDAVLTAHAWMSVVTEVGYNPGATAHALANEIHRGIGSAV